MRKTRSSSQRLCNSRRRLDYDSQHWKEASAAGRAELCQQKVGSHVDLTSAGTRE